MPTQQTTERNLGNIALLIDADNSQYILIDKIVEIVSRYGRITHRYAYGNWNKLTHWQPIMDKNAITPKHRWDYAKGKDATDMELVIDAMDMLHKKSVNSFVIVSSDSDFTSLFRRIFEEQLIVWGIGKKQAPDALVNSCDKFIYVEDIEQGVYHPPELIPPSPKTSSKNPYNAIPLIQQALTKLQNPTEWVHLGRLGNTIKKLDPNFQSSDYGHSKLRALIKSMPTHFDISEDGNSVSLKK
jgi:hypothetical protein